MGPRLDPGCSGLLCGCLSKTVSVKNGGRGLRTVSMDRDGTVCLIRLNLTSVLKTF